MNELLPHAAPCAGVLAGQAPQRHIGGPISSSHTQVSAPYVHENGTSVVVRTGGHAVFGSGCAAGQAKQLQFPPMHWQDCVAYSQVIPSSGHDPDGASDGHVSSCPVVDFVAEEPHDAAQTTRTQTASARTITLPVPISEVRYTMRAPAVPSMRALSNSGPDLHASTGDPVAQRASERRA